MFRTLTEKNRGKGCFILWVLFSNFWCFKFSEFFWQVDLFFYREPEEAKEPEEEETPALPDYADYSAATVVGDWSSSQIPDAQWAPEMTGTLPPVASGWTGEAG